MSRRALTLTVGLVAILAVFAVYFGFYGRNNKNINSKTEAASSSKTLTTNAEWTAGTNTNTTISADPNSSITINDKTAPQINLGALYIAHPGAITTDSDEANKGNLVDGNIATVWNSGIDLNTEYFWEIDLQSSYPLGKINVYANANDWWYKVDVSDDDLSYTNAVDWYQPGAGGWTNNNVSIESARFVKIVCGRHTTGPMAPPGVILGELNLFASSSAVHTSAATQLDGGTSHFKNWTTFVPTDTIPASTSVNFRFRTSADAGTWGSWTASTASAGSIDIATLLGATDAAKRYLQVETTLANTDGASTPTLDAYTANYNYSVLDHVTVTPGTASVVVNGTESLTASAIDDYADPILDATFTWSTTCGSVDAAGTTVTFTAPAAVPVGNTCTVTASSTVDGVTKTADSVITVTASPPAETCSDGIQNQNETAIDCGGVCAACPVVPTCSDGIQNGSETGVDCGGSCSACPVVPPVIPPVIPPVVPPDACANANHLTISPSNIYLIPNGSLTFAAKMFANDGSRISISTETVAWTTSGGTLINNGDDSARYTAPAAPGTYTVTASFCGKSVSATINVAWIFPANYCLNRCGTPGCSACPVVPPTTPTCTDGIQNGGETEVDCGGSCTACPIIPPENPATICVGDNCSGTGNIPPTDVNKLCIGSICAATPTNWPVNPLVVIPLLAALLLAVANPENLIAIGNAISRLFGFFVKGKEKKHAPGIVYDASSGLPISNVLIMLFRARDKKLISTTKSDKNGRFALETFPGEEYYVEIKSTGYDLADSRGPLDAELAYDQNYFAGNMFRPSDAEKLFDKALPLSANEGVLTLVKKIRLYESLSKILRAINLPLVIFGLTASVLVYYKNHTAINLAILCLYIALILYYVIKWLILNGRSSGKVYDKHSGHGIELATINMISETDGKLKATAVSDAKGKFLVALPKGFYKMIISKPGYNSGTNNSTRIKSSFTPARVVIGMNEIDNHFLSSSDPLSSPRRRGSTNSSVDSRLHGNDKRTITDSAEIIEKYNQKQAKFGTPNLADIGVHHLINQNTEDKEDVDDKELKIPIEKEIPKPEKPNWNIPNSGRPL